MRRFCRKCQRLCVSPDGILAFGVQYTAANMVKLGDEIGRDKKITHVARCVVNWDEITFSVGINKHSGALGSSPRVISYT